MDRLRGFTLVEVMLSVLILGAGLSLVANSYLAALRGINSSHNSIQAMLLAKEKFSELELISLENNGLTVSSAQAELSAAGKSYAYLLNIATINQPEYIAKYLLKACLTIRWQEQNAAKNITLSSYFQKPVDK